MNKSLLWLCSFVLNGTAGAVAFQIWHLTLTDIPFLRFCVGWIVLSAMMDLGFYCQ